MISANLAEQLARLPDYLGAHVAVSGAALVVGLAVSLPLGILASRSRSWGNAVVSVASVIQTIPGLALLALMVPLLGAFGFLPAWLALVLYSMLPVLRNTVVGLRTLDPAVLEAAQGVGMTPAQVLRRVELPLALPVIVAGVRTASVWVIGMATLSTPVGQASLGNFIFAGLQTRNWTAVLVGCGAAALLALLVDGLLGQVEAGLGARRRARAAGAAIAIVIVFAFGSGLGALAGGAPVLSNGSPVEGGPSAGLVPPDAAATLGHPLRVGAKTFTEQYVLSRLIERRARAAGLEVERVDSLGSTVALDALCNGQLDVYVDYTGTIYANAMKRVGFSSRWQVSAETAAWLARECGVRQLGGLGFENAYAFAMRRDRAAALEVLSIADLARVAPDLSLGSDYEFFQRPEWSSVRDAYQLHFGAQKSYDSTFMYAAARDGDVDVVTAFSSDGRIEAFDLSVLEDPKHALPPYDAVLLLGHDVARNPVLLAALQPLLGRIDVQSMRHANWLVDRDRDKRTPAQAAEWLDGHLSR